MSEDETATAVAAPSEAAPAEAVAAEPNRRRRKRRAAAGATAKSYYVFDVPKGKKPVLASRGPLTLSSARAFAETGAKYGKFDRVVTTDPKDKKSFTVVRKFRTRSR